jgi:metal-responsive CopG/Arc/MetJ family transcriptional regulator
MGEKQETITLSLPLQMLKELDAVASKSKTTRDKILSEALEQYFKSNELWEQIYKWGEESAKELGIRNEEDVENLIHEFRKEQSINKGSALL